MNATIPAVGLSIELHRAVRGGRQLGVAYFTTTVRNEDYKVTNAVVTPRLVFKPLRAFGKWRDNPRAGFLQMHWRPMVRFGKVDGASFGAPAEHLLAGTEVLVRSGSYVVFDVFEALRGR